MRYRSLFLSTLLSLLTLFSCSSCNDDNKEEVEEKKPTHTFLIYMAGDNSLSQYCNENIALLKKGLMDATNDINLVIYKDNRDSGDQLPTLFQLKKTYDPKTKVSKIDTVRIKNYYVEQNSCDPNVFKEVVNLTFSTFDTEIKGLELWSHGMSWIPSAAITKSTRYIGQDDYSYFELWDIRNALEGCPHLDYIMLDCCFTGLAEVAHEFDNVTDYVYGPITEIMGYGFPYSTMLPVLANCTVKSSVRPTLEACINDFSTCGIYGSDGYTITLLETAKADALAKSLAKLRNAVPAEKLAQMKTDARQIESSFQHYGRSIVGARYYFYEFQDYVDYLAKNESAEVKNIVNEIEQNNIVVKYAATSKFLEVDLKGCKGLGVSVPEFFWLTNDESRLKKYYGYTKWGKALGY